jgi:ribonuclease HI
MYFDGSLKLGGAGACALFISTEGKQLKYILQILWQAINNEAEYEALIHGLRNMTSLGIKRLLVYRDSAVVINQVNKDWDCTKNNMDTYCAEVRKLEKFPRTRNLTCSTRFKHRSRRPHKAGIRQGKGPARGVYRRTAIFLHKTTQWDNP